ncbi:MAG: hypothetical protein ABIA66_00385 [Candidatus Omnitrophota bacterium]
MKKLLLLLFFIVLFPAVLIAQTHQDSRRIEEEKRESLLPTERSIPEQTTIQTLDQYPDTSAYFQELVRKPVATFADAARVVVLLSGEQDSIQSFTLERSLLRERGIIGSELADVKENKTLRKGLLALLLCRALDIRGGIWKRLFTNSQRYALREMVHEGIISTGSTQERVSGKELIIMFTQAARYLAQKQTAPEERQ